MKRLSRREAIRAFGRPSAVEAAAKLRKAEQQRAARQRDVDRHLLRFKPDWAVVDIGIMIEEGRKPH